MPASPRALVFAAASVLLAACAGSPTVFRNSSSRIAEIRSVAVMPFENLASTESRTSERVHRIMLAELQANAAFVVIEPGLVAQAVGARSGALSALPPEELKALGTELRADALLLGTILSYAESRGPGGGEATIQLRLVETRSGTTVWTASHSRNGSSFAKRVFGLATDSGTEVARAVIRSEIKTIPRYAPPDAEWDRSVGP